MESATAPGRIPEAVNSITKHLRTVASRGYARHRVFEDWLDAMLYSIQGRDEPYLEIVERYDPAAAAAAPRAPDDEWDTAMDHFAAAYGELLHGSRRTGTELLGDVYEVFGHPSDHFGQYFTPHSVASAMVDFQGATAGTEGSEADDTPAEPPADPTTIGDPACGSGRLLVTARQLAPAGIFVGQDKDAVCAKMTAVNLMVFGLSGYAIHGDSLSIDQYRAWEVVNPPYGPPRCLELDPDEDPVPLSEQHWEQMNTESSHSAGPQSLSDEQASTTEGETAGASSQTAPQQVTLAELGGLSDR